jgi:hypothetical protein
VSAKGLFQPQWVCVDGYWKNRGIQKATVRPRRQRSRVLSWPPAFPGVSQSHLMAYCPRVVPSFRGLWRLVCAP